MTEGPLDVIFEAGEASLRWLEDYQRSLPIIRKQDVSRALADPYWLDARNLRRRAVHRAKVARLRCKARALDLDGYRRTERESRAKRCKTQRLRTQVASPPLSVPQTDVAVVLSAWPSVSALLAGPWHVKTTP